jgi:hypothetical protein
LIIPFLAAFLEESIHSPINFIMKKIIIVFLVLGLTGVYLACERDYDSSPVAMEEAIILQITNAENMELVGGIDLPASIPQYVEQHHPPFEIELAFRAPHLGYEIMLENGLCLFFDLDGNHLNHGGIHDDWSNPHGWSTPEGSYCLFGDPLDAGSLPQGALDYIDANYPGATVVTAVVKPSGKLSVELSGGEVLLFNPAGIFLYLCEGPAGAGEHRHAHGLNGGPGWYCEPGGMGPGYGDHHGHMGNPEFSNGPCWGGAGIPAGNLPEAITNYLSTHYPLATIVRVVQTYTGKYFLRLSDCNRLVFDEDGSIIFDSGG